MPKVAMAATLVIIYEMLPVGGIDGAGDGGAVGDTVIVTISAGLIVGEGIVGDGVGMRVGLCVGVGVARTGEIDGSVKLLPSVNIAKFLFTVWRISALSRDETVSVYCPGEIGFAGR